MERICYRIMILWKGLFPLKVPAMLRLLKMTQLWRDKRQQPSQLVVRFIWAQVSKLKNIPAQIRPQKIWCRTQMQHRHGGSLDKTSLLLLRLQRHCDNSVDAWSHVCRGSCVQEETCTVKIAAPPQERRGESVVAVQTRLLCPHHHLDKRA